MTHSTKLKQNYNTKWFECKRHLIVLVSFFISHTRMHGGHLRFIKIANTLEFISCECVGKWLECLPQYSIFSKGEADIDRCNTSNSVSSVFWYSFRSFSLKIWQISHSHQCIWINKNPSSKQENSRCQQCNSFTKFTAQHYFTVKRSKSIDWICWKPNWIEWMVSIRVRFLKLFSFSIEFFIGSLISISFYSRNRTQTNTSFL